LAGREIVMKKGRNTAEALDSDDALDDIELSGDGCQERTVILKAAPPSRRAQLIAHGAIEIRCVCCNQIRLLAGAEESDEGWICEGCLPEKKQKPKYGAQGRK
jgi:hypothetical protein